LEEQVNPLSHKAGKWALLLAISALMTLVLGTIGCPASQFLGPMIAGIALSLGNRTPTVPSEAFTLAQGFIGAMVARGIASDFWETLSGAWFYILGGTAWAIILGILSSLALFRFRLVHSSSAFWCLSPGGASIMVILAGQYGGDIRLVAFAQYFRVVLVSLAAVAVSAFLMEGTLVRPQAVVWFPPLESYPFVVTVLAVALGRVLANLVAFPSGSLLFPLLLAVIAQNALDIPIVLPPWLLYSCYAVVGWRIGLSFTSEVFAQILKIIPALFAAVVLMLIGCGVFSYFMVIGLGLEPLTAYLAACPGGLDAVTIIAIGSGANLSFVMAMQAMRLIVVIVSGPYIYGFLTKLFKLRV
jgi:membrane AbrB-like protein